jgi:hypothetical protein
MTGPKLGMFALRKILQKARFELLSLGAMRFALCSLHLDGGTET